MSKAQTQRLDRKNFIVDGSKVKRLQKILGVSSESGAIREIALAVRGGIKINAVDDALEQRISVSNGPKQRGELLADFVRKRADDGPNRIARILRFQREKEADKLLIVLHQLKRLSP